MDKLSIDKKIAEFKDELRKLRFDISLSKLQNTSKVKRVRREIARLFTQKNKPEEKK